jgi:hypothetical protein
MKTAMQELIELIVNNKTRLDIIEKNQQMWLEKEKDRMFHSFYAGVGYDEVLDDCDKIFEQYYNEVFNQNK